MLVNVAHESMNTMMIVSWSNLFCSHVILPIAREFKPDLVIISAGFDAADGDPLGECHVTPEMYGHLTQVCLDLQHVYHGSSRCIMHGFRCSIIRNGTTTSSQVTFAPVCCLMICTRWLQ